MRKIGLKTRIILFTVMIMIILVMCLTGILVHSAYKYYVIHESNNTYNIERDITGRKLEANNKEGLSIFYKLASQEATKEFFKISLIGTLIICCIGIIGICMIVEIAIKPLKQLNGKINEINENNLNERIHLDVTNDEVGSMMVSFNTMLDRLDKSFSNQKRFVADVVHELKTPLTIIKTDIEVLKLDDAPTLEDYKENLEVVEKSTERLIKVIENLMELTNERQDHLDEIISINEMISYILEELKPQIKAKHLDIQVHIEDALTKGNNILLYRAIFNVVQNAVKYNKENGYIKISSFKQQGEIQMIIEDTGIGIVQDELKYIFNAFYRSKEVKATKIEGIGLGLALTKQIIDKHKGRIEIESQKDIGTRVQVSLPEIKLLDLLTQSYLFLGNSGEKVKKI